MRIGLALSDLQALIASPHGALDVRADGSHLDRIADLVRDFEVICVVVGLPLRLDGGEGEEASQARQLALAIGERAGVEVCLYDERMTSKMAERALLEAGSKRHQRRRQAHGVAAALILQAYLQRRALQARQAPPEGQRRL